MIFNSETFESLRFWPGKTVQPDFHYTAPDGTLIEEKTHLGVELSNDLTFSLHKENTTNWWDGLIQEEIKESHADNLEISYSEHA